MVLVSVNNECITIVENGKRLILAKDTKLYEDLKVKTKDEIVKWYKDRCI